MERRKAMKDSALFIIKLAIITRILNFIRSMLMAANVGVGYEMDSYILALAAISLLSKIVGDGVLTSLIPVLRGINDQEGLEEKNQYTNNIINFSLLLGITISLGLYIFSPGIMALHGPGFSRQDLQGAIDLYRLGIPMFTLGLIRSIGGAYLQSDHAFKAGAKGGVGQALVYIIYFIFFFNKYEIRGLMLAGSFGVLPGIYFIYKAMYQRGYKYRPYLDLKDPKLRTLVLSLVPILVSIGVTEINWAVDNAIASTLEIGSIAELTYANDVIDLFLGIFTTAIVTVTFPVLAQDYNKKTCYIDGECFDLNRELMNSFELIMKITIPVSIILLTMAEPIIVVFFERGAFGTRSSIFTSEALTYYALGLSAMALVPLITRGYYAIHDNMTPVILGALGLIVNIILDLVLMTRMGIGGLALGTSIAMYLWVIFGTRRLNKVLNFTRDYDLGSFLGKTLVAGLTMALSILVVFEVLRPVLSNVAYGELMNLLAAGSLGLLVYLAVNRALKNPTVY